MQKPSLPSLPPLRQHPTRPTRGILWIGDPHVWSFKPGRRRDASFRDTVLNKIAQAVRISNERDLWPVFLGDLFHVPDDNDISTLIRLIRVLNAFERKPVTIDGNHDKDELTLSEKNPLQLLVESDQIELISSSAPWARLNLQAPDGREHLVVVGGTPYGRPIPQSFAEAFGAERSSDIGTALWVTHEDLAFEGAYPGALPLEPIPGVDIVVNGHMHATKLPVDRDGTVYYNPGNITRMSIDLAEHVPAVWEWSPFVTDSMASASGTRVPLFQRHALEHAPAGEAFDFEGRHARSAVLPAGPVAEEEKQSVFVQIIKEEPADERTDDGTHARESLEAVLVDLEVPEDVRRIAEHLCEQAIRHHQEEAS